MSDDLRDALEGVLYLHECTNPDTPAFNRALVDDLLAAVEAARASDQAVVNATEAMRDGGLPEGRQRMSTDFVAADGHRWWLDSRKCNHTNENVCAFCDHDDYYANTYPSVPWREIHPDEDGDL